MELSGTGNAFGSYQGISWSASGIDNALLTRQRAASPAIRVEGYKYLILLDQYDGTRRYRAQVQVKDTAGNALTNGSLVKAVKVYDPAGNELPLSGNFYLWNGSDFNYDSGAGIAPNPLSDMEVYLDAAPGTLATGFYTIILTDINGNHFPSEVYFESTSEIGKPNGLSRTFNPDGSITLSWTNPAGISSPAYQILVYVVSNDTNGDGLQDIPLVAALPTITNTYTIPASFVQTSLVGKQGLKWMVEIRQRTTGTVNVPCGPPYTAHFYRTRSTQETLPVNVLFSVSDLVGTWDYHQFQTSSATGGGGAGWFRLVVRFDGTGTMIVDDNTTWEANGAPAGDPVPPNGPSPFIWTVDPSGVITVTGDSTFYGIMSSNKQMIVATTTLSSTDKAIRVLRKRFPGTVFSSSDIHGKSFTLHDLYAGSNNGWNYGSGAIDASGTTSMTMHNSAGETTVVTAGPMSIDSNGVVTVGSIPTFKGVMTADKSIIFATMRGDTVPSLEILTMSGQTFAQADLAGTWRTFTITSGSPVNWLHSTLSMDSSGSGTFSNVVSSSPETLGPVAWTLSAAGEVDDPANPPWSMFHGNMSFGKNLMCITATEGTTEYGLSLVVK
jgi:hypothetical protein